MSEFEDPVDPMDSEDGPLNFPFLPRDNLKTNLAAILFAALSHYLYGIFFNAYESVNARYNYPNFGSMSFVLGTAILLVRFDLSLRNLPIARNSWKSSLYTILAVGFLTHLVLAGIWQQMVNLTWEAFFVLKEALEILNNRSETGFLAGVTSRMTQPVVNLLTHLEGLAVLSQVITSRPE